MAVKTYHVETVYTAEATGDAVLEARLNTIVNTLHGTIVTVFPISCVKPLTDPLSGMGLYHWMKIIWTS